MFFCNENVVDIKCKILYKYTCSLYILTEVFDVKKFKIGFIGTGNIATAIYNGITTSGYITPDKITVFDTSIDKTCYFKNNGSFVANDAKQLCLDAEYVFLTVKPQIYNVVLESIKDAANDVCFIDVAAGISINKVKELLGFNAPVIRVMPNTPISVGLGSSALVKVDPVTDAQFEFIKGCFDSCGVTAVVSEEQINTVIAVSGSSPAYIMRFAKLLADFAKDNGLNEQDAIKLVTQTLSGCAKLINESNVDISTLISNVTSPNGTTEAGLKSLDSASFDNVVYDCLNKTVKRAEELSK